tara:strand:- start:2712 stop:3323 length:612 start_codon:yes stop_codon:yes gene_type:complete
MSLFGPVMYFTLGFIIAFLFPRLPIILITRGRGFNTAFPEHPEPIPLSPKLTQRVLHMRMIYWMGFVVATIPLMFGLASIKWGNTAFGFGLWLSSGWFMLSRLQTFVGGPDPPWTLETAQRLQIVMDKTKSDSRCCNYPKPEWRILTISCSNCGKLLDELPRPDLGRKRMDGVFAGGFRLLLTDGHPTIIEDDESRYFQDSEE